MKRKGKKSINLCEKKVKGKEAYWIYYMGQISKNIFLIFLFGFLNLNITFAIPNLINDIMRMAISGESLLLLKHRNPIDDFFGGTGDREESETTEIKKAKIKQTDAKTRIKLYKLNKQKVRKKAQAFGQLDSSKMFLGFYSVSFPKDFADNYCRKCLNVWLTKLREKYDLNNYMWVAERQKNGTLHFHMLTNKKMPIQEVNKDMAKIIQYYVEKKKLDTINFNYNTYNGVDLSYAGKKSKKYGKNRYQKQQSLTNRVKFISAYLAKYVSKSNEKYAFLPSHYSRSISKLYTGCLLNPEEQELMENVVLKKDDISYFRSEQYFEVIRFKDGLPQWVKARLLHLNNEIYEKELAKNIRAA